MNQVMWFEGLATITETFADHEGSHQTCNRCVDVNNRSTCEVQHAFLEQPTCFRGHRCQGVGIFDVVRTRPEPDHVSDRQVAEREPEHHEAQHRGKLCALGKSTDDQAASDGGESSLEHNEDKLRNDNSFTEGRGIGVWRDACQEQSIELADKGTTFGEGKTVAICHPQDCDQGEDHNTLHHDRQDVLATCQATIKK